MKTILLLLILVSVSCVMPTDDDHRYHGKPTISDGGPMAPIHPDGGFKVKM